MIRLHRTLSLTCETIVADDATVLQVRFQVTRSLFSALKTWSAVLDEASDDLLLLTLYNGCQSDAPPGARTLGSLLTLWGDPHAREPEDR